jgi:hypothetical protein
MEARLLILSFGTWGFFETVWVSSSVIDWIVIWVAKVLLRLFSFNGWSDFYGTSLEG